MNEYLIGNANNWMNEDFNLDGEVDEQKDDLDEKEVELFSLSEDLIGGVTYEQLINVVEANEEVIDEDSVEKVFVEELSRIVENARENFESHKDKIMAELTGGEEDNE